MHYTATIFKESGSTIDPNLSTIITGILQVLGFACAAFSMDLIGRKVLLLISAAGAFVGLLATSFFTYFVVQGSDLRAYDAVPVIFLSFFNFAISIGFGAVPFILIPELMPRNVIFFSTLLKIC